MTPAEVLDQAAAPTLGAIGNTHAASALQAVVIRDGEIVLDHAVGVAQFEPARPFDHDTPLDLASLTKVFTATLVMQAVSTGRCKLDAPIARWVDGWHDTSSPVTLRHLLNHSSGLPAWDQFYLRMPITPDVTTAAATRAEIERQIIAKPRQAPGVTGTYSDLGYILLGRLVERIFDDDLEELVERHITRPLGLHTIRYVSLRRGDAPITHAAATEIDPRRGGVMVGRVHDENCFIQGGVEGHAGLFGVARDVARFGQHLLDIDHGEAGVVAGDVLQFCWSLAARGGDGHHLGGWDTPSGEQSSAGRGFMPHTTVGHLGFTGTSLWIERHQRIVAVLLTNRVYPTRENARIKDLRIRFHDAVSLT